MSYVEIVILKNNLKDLRQELIAEQYWVKETLTEDKDHSRYLGMKERQIQVATIDYL